MQRWRQRAVTFQHQASSCHQWHNSKLLVHRRDQLSFSNRQSVKRLRSRERNSPFLRSNRHLFNLLKMQQQSLLHQLLRSLLMEQRLQGSTCPPTTLRRTALHRRLQKRPSRPKHRSRITSSNLQAHRSRRKASSSPAATTSTLRMKLSHSCSHQKMPRRSRASRRA